MHKGKIQCGQIKKVVVLVVEKTNEKIIMNVKITWEKNQQKKEEFSMFERENIGRRKKKKTN